MDDGHTGRSELGNRMNKFGEFLPDQPGFANPGVTQATNVVPVAAGYKSFNAMSSFSNAATAYLRGIFAGKGSDSSSNVFAGDATKLYKYASSDNDLDNVSKAGDYQLTNTDRWKFVQFGDRIIAAHGTDDILQSYVIGTSSLFADLTGSPAARHVAVVRDFVVTGHVKYGATAYPRRVRWSGIDDATAWTVGSDQSDIQDISDLGNVTGIVGGEFGTVLCERGIVRMSYVGSPIIFQFDKVETSRGCPYPGSICNVGPAIFYLSQDGFYIFDGTSSTSIGNEKVDRSFFAEFNTTEAARMSSAVDPRNQLVMWSYPTSGSTPNRILIYNYALGRWSKIEQENDLVSSFFSPTQSLEGLDNVNASLDDLGTSLDDALWVGGEYLSGGGKDNKITRFSGALLPATIEVGELEATPGLSSMMTQIQPYVSAAVGTTPSVSAQVATRSRPFDTQTYSDAVSINSDNVIPVRTAGRFHQVKFTASDFDVFQGFDLTLQSGGLR